MRIRGVAAIFGLVITAACTSAFGQIILPPNPDLGFAPVGGFAGPIVVPLVNTGGASVSVYGIVSGDPVEFQISGSTCSVLPAGATCTFEITFTPVVLGTRTSTIEIASTAPGSPQFLIASGNAISPEPLAIQIPIVEYYHAGFNHYFITGTDTEITALDDGTISGWSRTGQQFKAYRVGSGRDTADVCRFFSAAFAPKSSHFYTPFESECATVKQSADWQFEGQVFSEAIPTADGACASGLQPVYRLYNNGQGGAPNHRYTTNYSVRTAMLSQGWIPEGYGPNGVIMCAPQ